MTAWPLLVASMEVASVTFQIWMKVSTVADVQVAAGDSHTILLRSDGTAVSCGRNQAGQRDIPVLGDGMRYTQVSAGLLHTVLLRSDGTAVACGDNGWGQCDIPSLSAGVTYTEISAGHRHTVLVCSDGTAVACGSNTHKQCTLPTLAAGLTYGVPTLVLQASCDGDSIDVKTFGGETLCHIRAAPTDRLINIYADLMIEPLRRFGNVHIILPGGELLRNLPAEETVGRFFGLCER
ncbi:unnamed protein product [Prorocentrum cordatum]|uniref:Uncharacterized protein n=1 Tax=Prorocentrum cordatum TaxID=2364126 RepID=A0ABN9QG07_9DINO|nr:unnamed protein product [Polarella glacialis]